MTDHHTTGETHGCIVCGRLYQLYVVKDRNGKFVDCKIMSQGAKVVPDKRRPLVACEIHTDEQIENAVVKAYGKQSEDDEIA
jgi:hypothetical protein